MDNLATNPLELPSGFYLIERWYPSTQSTSSPILVLGYLTSMGRGSTSPQGYLQRELAGVWWEVRDSWVQTAKHIQYEIGRDSPLITISRVQYKCLRNVLCSGRYHDS